MSTTIDTPEGIRKFHLLQLKYAMKLEMKGMKLSRGRSAFGYVKQQFKLKGNREKVYTQFCAMHGLEA